MSDESQNVTSDESPNLTRSSAEAAKVAESLAQKGRSPSMMRQYWWIPVTFIVPFAVIYEYLGGAAHSNLAACFRSGAIG